MDKPTTDTVMTRTTDRARAAPGYILAAAAIWALILYSLAAPPQPQRLAMQTVNACPAP